MNKRVTMIILMILMIMSASLVIAAFPVPAAAIEACDSYKYTMFCRVGACNQYGDKWRNFDVHYWLIYVTGNKKGSHRYAQKDLNYCLPVCYNSCY